MKYQKLFYILMFSPLVVSVIALCFLPDFIPAHYNLKNTVDRWGSKYELLIFPMITILFGQFLLLLGKMAKKQKTQGNNNEKMSLIIGNCSLLIFNILSGTMIYSSVTKAENLSFFSLEFGQMIFLIMGVVFIILGNIMPKLKMNSVLGFRTKWSMKNDEVWKKCQKVSGMTTMISGIVIMILSFHFHHSTLSTLVVITMLLSLMIDILYSYQVAKSKTIL